MANKVKLFQGCLSGAQIGDAMGMPVESMSRAEILAATNGEGISGFVDPIQTRIKDMTRLEAGDSTDDWQLTQILARSLCQMRQFDIVDIANEHIIAMARSIVGWGGTTKQAIEEVKIYQLTKGKEGRHPEDLAGDYGHNRGAGNGVAMKIAPLALFHSSYQITELPLLLDVLELGRLTHYDPRASSTAAAVALIIRYVINQPVSNHDSSIGLLQSIYDNIKYFEKTILKVDSQFDLTMTKWLKKFLKNPAEYLLADIETLIEKIGTGCFCLESVPFAIAVFLRHPRDFRAGVLEAVNAGGDTDTTASMAGAMIGANVGLDGIPEEWRTFRPEFYVAPKIGRELHELSLKEK
ncbi:MAG: ADP-ribosylglycohydrolase family protein [bacterium]|nr:ADP-ribosylglycohydrolase family protein [bacterium]